jgi:hypothetical protein
LNRAIEIKNDLKEIGKIQNRIKDIQKITESYEYLDNDIFFNLSSELDFLIESLSYIRLKNRNRMNQKRLK